MVSGGWSHLKDSAATLAVWPGMMDTLDRVERLSSTHSSCVSVGENWLIECSPSLNWITAACYNRTFPPICPNAGIVSKCDSLGLGGSYGLLDFSDPVCFPCCQRLTEVCES